MSRRSWIASLDRALRQAASDAPLRPALVGVGNPLNGDDGIGPAIIQALQAQPALSGRALFLDTGVAPENFTGPLRRYSPNIIILIDAAEMNLPPGGIALLDWTQSDGLSATSHSLPPSVLARYLSSELACPVYLLGIQPLRLEFDAPLSPPLRQARATVTRVLRPRLSGEKSPR